MTETKGCCVCSGDHRENKRYKREKVTEYINRFKANHPQKMLSIERMDFVIDIMLSNLRFETDASLGDCVVIFQHLHAFNVTELPVKQFGDCPVPSI